MVEPMKACPTPWCEDGKPQHVNGTLKYDNRIRCTSCGVQSPSAASRDEAITAWNQRAHPTAEVGDIVERLRSEAAEWDEPEYEDETDMRGMLCKAADLIQSLQSRLSISDENVERVARALVLPLGYTQQAADNWEGVWVGSNIHTPETGSLKYLCFQLARSVIASLGGVG